MSVRLPATDLANLSFRSPGFKTKFLSAWLAPKQIDGSYEPLRRSVGEAAYVGLPLLPDVRPTTFQQLEELVLRECKGNGRLISMNLAPVRAIRGFIDRNGAEAEFLQDLPLTLFPGMRWSFWAPMLIRYDGVARVVFLDLRRKGGLTVQGFHTCFSIMHERFRAADPDFSSVRFEVWRFANNAARDISVVPEWAAPIGFAAIIADVSQTYAILTALRADTARDRTGTDFGPLFGGRD